MNNFLSDIHLFTDHYKNIAINKPSKNLLKGNVYFLMGDKKITLIAKKYPNGYCYILPENILVSGKNEYKILHENISYPGVIKAYSPEDITISTSSERGKFLLSLGNNLAFPEAKYLADVELDWGDGTIENKRLSSGQLYSFKTKYFKEIGVYNIKLKYSLEILKSELGESISPSETLNYSLNIKSIPEIENINNVDSLFLGIDQFLFKASNSTHVIGKWNDEEGYHIPIDNIDGDVSINFPADIQIKDKNTFSVVPIRVYDIAMTIGKEVIFKDIEIITPSYPISKQLNLLQYELSGTHPSILGIGIFSINFASKEETKKLKELAKVNWGDGTSSNVSFRGDNNVKTLYVNHNYNVKGTYSKTYNVEIVFNLNDQEFSRRIKILILSESPEGEGLVFNRNLKFDSKDKSAQLLAITDNPSLEIKLNNGNVVYPLVFESGRYSIYVKGVKNRNLEVSIDSIPYLVSCDMIDHKNGIVDIKYKDGKMVIEGYDFSEKEVTIEWPKKTKTYPIEDGKFLITKRSRGEREIKVIVGGHIFKKI